MLRALVTGGAGFIGSNLVDRLVKERYEVSVVDDLSAGHLDFLKNAKLKNLLKTTFADPAVLQLIRARTFDVIFHEAAIPRVSYSVEHPVETTEVNVMDTVKLLDACRGNVRGRSIAGAVESATRFFRFTRRDWYSGAHDAST